LTSPLLCFQCVPEIPAAAVVGITGDVWVMSCGP